MVRAIFLTAVTLLTVQAGTFSGASAASPFNNISGRWTGFGWVYLNSGDRERVRCRAVYSAAAGGRSGSQDLRCGSTAGYNIHATSQMRYRGGSVSGNWSEVNFGTTGTVAGVARSNSLSLQLAGAGLSAAMAVKFNQCRQNVNIDMNAGDITRITIALRRC